MDARQELMMEEYRSLQEEHRRNRSLIFERPIAILGFVAVAIGFSYGSAIGLLVLAALVFVLYFNIWFINNRIESDARIVAYIQMVHESELRSKWVGWKPHSH